MSVRMEDLKPGDSVTVEAKIVRATQGRVYLMVGQYACALIDGVGIVTHTPKPHVYAVGEHVQVRSAGGFRPWRIAAIEDGHAILRDDKVAKAISMVPLAELQPLEVSVAPAPAPAEGWKVGDLATWGTGLAKYKIAGIRGRYADMWHPTAASVVKELADLRKPSAGTSTAG